MNRSIEKSLSLLIMSLFFWPFFWVHRKPSPAQSQERMYEAVITMQTFQAMELYPRIPYDYFEAIANDLNKLHNDTLKSKSFPIDYAQLQADIRSLQFMMNMEDNNKWV
jgi:hypothetical protein